jgi:lipoate-protein ligase A
MQNATFKVKGGKMIKVNLTVEKSLIKQISLYGDFFLHPEETIDELEVRLLGKEIKENVLLNTIEKLLCEKDAQLLGISPEDIVKCILMACGKNG